MTDVEERIVHGSMRTSSRTPRRDRALFAGESAALVALTGADLWGFVPLSRTPFLILLAWVSLRMRGLAWRDLGFTRPPRPGRAFGLGIAAGIGIELLAINVTTPLIAAFTGVPLDTSDFRAVVGNVQLLVVFVVLSWVLAAFGEELAFRGYLMNRLAGVLGGRPAAWVSSLVITSVYFGVGHGNQGLTGTIQESLSGFWLGGMFVLSGGNLTIPIVAHGVSNTLAFVLIYYGRYPGLA